MPFIAIIISGLIGTGVMTGVMYLFSFISERTMKVPKILGTMLTFSTTADGKLCKKPLCISVGLVSHYAMGIFFMFSYYVLWHLNIGRPDVFYALIFGFVHGVIAILIWRIFFYIHPNPPTIPLTSYSLGLLIGHVFFALSGIISYNLTNQILRIGEIQP